MRWQTRQFPSPKIDTSPSLININHVRRIHQRGVYQLSRWLDVYYFLPGCLLGIRRDVPRIFNSNFLLHWGELFSFFFFLSFLHAIESNFSSFERLIYSSKILSLVAARFRWRIPWFTKCVHDFVDFKDDSCGICKRILSNILFKYFTYYSWYFLMLVWYFFLRLAVEYLLLDVRDDWESIKYIPFYRAFSVTISYFVIINWINKIFE